jgi:hypothetical protein
MATPTTLPASFTAGQVLTAAQMNDLRGAFRILQVVSTIKTDTFSTSSTSWTDVTGLTASITPSATSSKVLVIASVTGTHDVGVQQGGIRTMRDSTAIFVGDTAGNRLLGNDLRAASGDGTRCISVVVLDSPNTTSATTYKIQAINSGAGTMHINRSDTDSDGSGFFRSASSITVLEVSA